MADKRVLAVGYINLDIILVLDKYPEEGKLVKLANCYTQKSGINEYKSMKFEHLR